MTIYTPPAFQTDPARVKRIAIVQDGRMHIFTISDPRRGSGAAYADTITLAPPHEFLRQVFWANVSAVWMLDGHGFAASALAIVPTLAKDPQYTAHELSSDGMLCGMIAQRRDPVSGKGRGEPIGIYAVWVNDFWGISIAASILSPREVAEGLALASHLLDMQLRFSPSYTGLQMLRQELGQWERRNGDLPELSPAWREQLLSAELRPTYAEWRGPLDTFPEIDPANKRSFPLWVYDRNSSFVSSAREVGVGDPEPTTTYQPGRPGVYRVSAWSHATYWPGMLPGPFCVGEGIGEYPVNHYGPAVWAWEPQIRHAIRAGYQVQIEDGFYWPKGRKEESRVHDLFRPWQTRFWDARRVARGWGGPGALAAALVKKVGVATIGRLVQRDGRALVTLEQAQREGLRIVSRETDAAGELTGNAEVEMALGRTDLVQPGWWSVIIANSNERLWNALYTQAPQTTALAYIDGLYLTQEAPALDGDRDKPGGWRAQGRLDIPAAQVERLNELGPGELVKAFARYDREQALETAKAVARG